MHDYKNFNLGDVPLQSGITLRSAQIAYKTYGTLNSNRDNCIIFPTFFGSQHDGNEPMIGRGMALDPDKYFIVIPNLLGNGLSSSPSNNPPPFDRARFPSINYYDNIQCQHRLLIEEFQVNKIALACGFSMGAQQSFHWGALFPNIVERIAPWCGSAKTSNHNLVFLEGVKAALTTDQTWQNGWYERQPIAGLRAMARVYAGWGPSQSFYREQVYLDLGFSSIEDYIVQAWEGRFLQRDANDILSMINTWQQGDISDNPIYQGDLTKALSSITAKAILMPSQTDQYFPPEDNQIEVQYMPNAEVRVIPSIWGHGAGGPGRNPVDTKFIDDNLKELLGS